MIASLNYLEWRSCVTRTRRFLPKCTIAYLYLKKQWPSKDKVIPEIGSVICDESNINHLLNMNNPFWPPIYEESFGYNIYRSRNKDVFWFDIRSGYANIVFCSKNTNNFEIIPYKYYDHLRIIRKEKIAHNVWIVQYR